MVPNLEKKRHRVTQSKKHGKSLRKRVVHHRGTASKGTRKHGHSQTFRRRTQVGRGGPDDEDAAAGPTGEYDGGRGIKIDDVEIADGVYLLENKFRELEKDKRYHYMRIIYSRILLLAYYIQDTLREFKKVYLGIQDKKLETLIAMKDNEVENLYEAIWLQFEMFNKMIQWTKNLQYFSIGSGWVGEPSASNFIIFAYKYFDDIRDFPASPGQRERLHTKGLIDRFLTLYPGHSGVDSDFFKIPKPVFRKALHINAIMMSNPLSTTLFKPLESVPLREKAEFLVCLLNGCPLKPIYPHIDSLIPVPLDPLKIDEDLIHEFDTLTHYDLPEKKTETIRPTKPLKIPDTPKSARDLYKRILTLAAAVQGVASDFIELYERADGRDDTLKTKYLIETNLEEIQSLYDNLSSQFVEFSKVVFSFITLKHKVAYRGDEFDTRAFLLYMNRFFFKYLDNPMNPDLPKSTMYARLENNLLITYDLIDNVFRKSIKDKELTIDRENFTNALNILSRAMRNPMVDTILLSDFTGIKFLGITLLKANSMRDSPDKLTGFLKCLTGKGVCTTFDGKPLKVSTDGIKIPLTPIVKSS